jgi:hypothetical protein
MDPQSLPFPTIEDVEIIQDLIVDLATTIYAKPERKATLLKGIHTFPKYAHFNISYWTEATLPPTLTDLLTFYFSQPITEKDRMKFLNTYKLPFMGTGKPVKDLYTINPAVFKPVLDALIQSKRIQRIISQPNTLDTIHNMFQFRKRILQNSALEKFDADLNTIRRLLLENYEDQEQVIATTFIEAQSKEPKFLAPEEVMKAKIIDNVARRKRKSRRGGNRRTRKGGSLRRRR